MYIQRFSISLYYVNKRLVILFIIVSIIIIIFCAFFMSLPLSFSNKNNNCTVSCFLCHIKEAREQDLRHLIKTTVLRVIMICVSICFFILIFHHNVSYDEKQNRERE